LVIRAAMTFTLAFRNLFHDRIRLAVTMVGILFSIVLVAVQLGLYLGARNIIVSMIDRSDGDLWIMAYGTKNFEEAQPINVREKFAALSTPGVAKAVPIAERVQQSFSPNIVAMFTVSGTGLLAYATGADAFGLQLSWFDRTGKALGTIGVEAKDRRSALLRLEH
jgi:ABC-type antimicrobial peptide transport system permease subunit